MSTSGGARGLPLDNPPLLLTTTGTVLNMDIDEPEVILPSKAKKQSTLPVDDAHPFDLEAYISGYKGTSLVKCVLCAAQINIIVFGTGRTVVDRLIWIIPQCPPIAVQAVQIAMTIIPQLRDPNLPTSLQYAYEAAVASGVQEDMPPFAELANVDQAWVDELVRRNTEDRVKLEVELKTYSSNMIKESIRVSSML